MSLLERAWWRLNSAMGETESCVWWRFLLFLRGAVVYRLMLITDAEHRRAHAEIKGW